MKLAGWQRCQKQAPMKPFLVVKTFRITPIPTPHEQPTLTSSPIATTTTDPTTKPRSVSCDCERQWELRRAPQSRRGSTGSITTITAVATRTKAVHQPLPPPPPPPLPPLPHHRRQNRCHCGECCVCREINTTREYSFHAKVAVAVDAVTTAITITSGGSSHHRLHQLRPPPPPPESLPLRRMLCLPGN